MNFKNDKQRKKVMAQIRARIIQKTGFTPSQYNEHTKKYVPITLQSVENGKHVYRRTK